MQITFLGTGHGMPKQSSCSAIFVEEEKNNLLLDVGGGHEIIRAFESVHKKPQDIRAIFISHYDSDHILGIVPLVRSLRHQTGKKFIIFCSAAVKEAVDSLFTIVARNHFLEAQDKLDFIIVTDGSTQQLNGWEIRFFDTHSFKTPQLGCYITFSNGQTLAFGGDAPLVAANRALVKGCTALIHEAFCLERDSAVFEPHPKDHSTVAEAAKIAAQINPEYLLLFHMEDTTLSTRQTAYTAEAKEYFNGRVVVPVDGDKFEF